MKIPTVQSERLRKLADLLLSPDYDKYIYMVDEPEEVDEGGYVGTGLSVLAVVLTESIKIFPGEWVKNEHDKFAYFKEDELKNPCTSAMLFYGLDPYMFQHLFIPQRQNTLVFGGSELATICTPAEVADNIHAFVTKYQSIMN